MHKPQNSGRIKKKRTDRIPKGISGRVSVYIVHVWEETHSQIILVDLGEEELLKKKQKDSMGKNFERIFG